MYVRERLLQFVRGEAGAVSVDYTVLSAAAVGMAMSAAAILTGGVQDLTQRIDAELRTRQLSDSFIAFDSSHFEPLYEMQFATPEDAAAAFLLADDMMNQEVIDALTAGLMLAQQEELSRSQMTELFALASIAYQRNIIDDAVLTQYFGIGD